MTAGGSAKPRPYPGYGNKTSPVAGPRVKSEGEQNFIRNKGTIKARLFDDKAPIIKTPKPEPRCPTNSSRKNYKLGWFGNIQPMLNGTASPRPCTAPPRVKSEAADTAAISQGPRMKTIVHDFAKAGASPRQPRVKPEAEETAEVSKGGRMSNLLHKYGTMPLSARAVPRLKLEAEPIADLSRGKRMNDTLHKYAQRGASPRPEHRVKPEAGGNAELDKGKRMDFILHQHGPRSSRSMPRVKSEGESNAYLDRGVRMSRLMHSPKAMSASPRPLPRTNTSQAKENAWRGRGSMDKVFQHIAKKTFVYVPGTQSKAYMRASIA